ncbi:MarR family transcriptional regulator [Microlunatus elymi]|uniref:MarR family transcriptional regulator n=1 Tax=Microlunatus elymi TaxID=2596828 RepID=A0A516Q6B2_9ACTN|nr:MarR family transcriptional regulator [Microlunatus elymi]QDP98978.1 MarR family transcriptional regulator [Microlunatus elymi]
MRRAARSADPGNKLSVAQLELLSAVAENPGARPGRIARYLHLAPNSVTTLVNGLQAAGLVTRSSNPDDRRTVQLSLTADGETAVRRWHATNSRILRTSFEELHPGWQQLISAALPALRELIGSIDQLVEPGQQNSRDAELRVPPMGFEPILRRV